jgi:hypothetical protein
MTRLSFGLGLLISLGWVTEASAQAVAPAPPAVPTATIPTAPPATDNTTPPAVDQTLPPAPPAPSGPAPALADNPPPPAPLAPTAPASTVAPIKRSRTFATLQLGGGYFHATSGTDSDTRRFSGGTISGLLAVGGRMGQRRTVALAGAFLRDQVLGLRSKDQRIDGDEPNLDNVKFGLWAVGILLDVATQWEPGLHFQGLAGVGALSVSRGSRSSGDPDDPTGLMASVAAGYEFKVGEHWALGGLLRATYAPLDVNESTGTTVYVVVPALLLTASGR